MSDILFLRFCVFSSFYEFVGVAFSDHVARLCSVGRTNDAAFFEHVDEFRRTRVTDSELPLQVRSRCLTGFYYSLFCLRVQLIFFVFISHRRKYRIQSATDFSCVRKVDLTWKRSLSVFHDERDHFLYLAFRKIGSLDATRFRHFSREEEHVACAEQFLRTPGVENGARVDLRSDLERNARRDVGLDEAGDDLYRWTLCRKDEVDADGAAHLRQSHDAGFELARIRRHDCL